MTQPAQDAQNGGDLSGVLDDVPLTVEESLDSDDLGDTDAGLDPLDDSWDAPDRPSPEIRLRPTASELRDGSPLDEQLAQEIPDIDPYLEAQRTESGLVLDDDVAGIGTPFTDPDPVPRPAGLIADGLDGSDPLTGRAVARADGRPGDDSAWPLAPEDAALHLD